MTKKSRTCCSLKYEIRVPVDWRWFAAGNGKLCVAMLHNSYFHFLLVHVHAAVILVRHQIRRFVNAKDVFMCQLYHGLH